LRRRILDASIRGVAETGRVIGRLAEGEPQRERPVRVIERDENKMRASMKIVPAVGLAVSALALSALPAGAATPATVKATAPVGFSSAAPAVVPNSNLKAGKTAGTVVYSPTKVSTTWSAASEETCTSALVVLDITNKTTAAQTVTYKNQPEFKIPKKKILGICIFGSGTATLKLGVEGQTSKLTINLS
jgi:hypothetical protein